MSNSSKNKEAEDGKILMCPLENQLLNRINLYILITQL